MLPLILHPLAGPDEVLEDWGVADGDDGSAATAPPAASAAKHVCVQF